MRHLLTLADLTAAEIERIFSITEDLKSKFAARAARAAAAGPRDGPAVREAVAADARQLRGGHGPSRRQLDVPGQRGRLRPPRERRRFRPRAGRVRRRGRRPRQPPPDGRRTGRALHLLGHQRPDRFRPSLPGAGRSVHDPRAGRQAGRAHAGLDRRRQQRGPKPGRRLRQAGHEAGHGHAARSISSTTKSLAWIKQQVARAGSDGHRPIRSRRCATRWRSTPTFGRAWARRAEKEARRQRLRRLSGERRS